MNGRTNRDEVCKVSVFPRALNLAGWIPLFSWAGLSVRLEWGRKDGSKSPLCSPDSGTDSRLNCAQPVQTSLLHLGEGSIEYVSGYTGFMTSRDPLTLAEFLAALVVPQSNAKKAEQGTRICPHIFEQAYEAILLSSLCLVCTQTPVHCSHHNTQGHLQH